MILKKGQLIAITTGEYSDYCLVDHMRLLCDLDFDVIRREFFAQKEPLKEREYDDAGFYNQFLVWAIKMNYLESLEPDTVLEVYFSKYGELDITVFTNELRQRSKHP